MTLSCTEHVRLSPLSAVIAYIPASSSFTSEMVREGFSPGTLHYYNYKILLLEANSCFVGSSWSHERIIRMSTHLSMNLN